jgi:hypothetical protein
MDRLELLACLATPNMETWLEIRIEIFQRATSFAVDAKQ